MVFMLLLVVVSGTTSRVPMAATNAPTVLVVSQENSEAHAGVLASLREIVGTRAAIQTQTLQSPGQSGLDARAGSVLLVAIGTQAALRAFEELPHMPVLCVLIPEASFHALTSGRHGNRQARVSGVTLDQPFVRQLRLIRLAMPVANQVGVVLGPDSRRHEPELRRAATLAGLDLRTEIIGNERQLVGALHRVMEESDILLAVPDPQVFNRHTAQHVLRTAHARNKPVAGYSRAYVSAGALLAVYSTPEQIGRQAGALVLQFLESGRLPVPQSPREFAVEVNPRVANSLGLKIPDEPDLVEQLKAAEGVR